MNENTAHFTQGFTLIELLIVIAVIGVLTTFGVIQIASYSKNQKLVQAQAEVVNTFALAKSRAQSQIKPTGCTGTLVGYLVRIGATTYRVTADCSGTDFSFPTKRLPTGVSFSGPGSNSNFEFRLLTGVVNEAAVTGTSFTLNLSGVTPRTVTVYRDGRYEAE